MSKVYVVSGALPIGGEERREIEGRWKLCIP
jgi:hypothetical protein